MTDTIRSIGSIVAGAIGFAVGGPLGFAVATVLFNVVVPIKPVDTKGSKGKSDSKNTAVDTAIFQVFGMVEREGGEVLRCAKDADGVRSGIRVRTTSGGGGGSPLFGGTPTAPAEKQYLNASFGLCEGPTFIDKVIESTSQNGERVIFDRYVDEDGNPNATAIEVDGKIVGYNFTDETASGGELEMTPAFGAVTGDLVAQLSETVRIYFGTEEQPIDSAEQEWYDEGVSADRGVTKIVFNDYGPLENGTTFKFWLRNSLNNRRDIITARLVRAGVPHSRIDLRSIPEDLTSYGWWVEGIEPARQLPEEIAAFSIHDLHFMATSRGMAFTDIARANPRYIVIDDEEMGAFPNNGGGGELQSSSAPTVQSGESKPREIKVNLKNQTKNFKDDGVVVMWPGAGGQSQTITLRLVGYLSEAFDFGEVTMRELQSMEGTTEINLMPGRCQVSVGCVLNVPEPSIAEPQGRRLLRVVAQKVSPEGVLACTCALYDPAAYSEVNTPPIDEGENPPTPRRYGNPQLVWIDGVSITADMSRRFTMLVCGRVEDNEDWGRTIIGIQNPTGLQSRPGSWTLVNPGNCGVLNTAYSFGGNDEYAFDYDTVLQITLDAGGSLSSCSEADVSDKFANTLWLASGSSGTYIAFTTVTPISPSVYQISGIMPGLYGSDWAAVRSIAMGARVVQVTNHLGQRHSGIIEIPWWDYAVNRDQMYAATNLLDGRRKTQGLIKYRGNNMRVLPVAPFVGREDDLAGGFKLRFFARSRNPEAVLNYWEAEMPVRHTDPFEYELQIRDAGGTVLDERTVISTTSELVSHFTAAELAAIYPGGIPAPVRGRIRGSNNRMGAGFWREFEV